MASCKIKKQQKYKFIEDTKIREGKNGLLKLTQRDFVSTSETH